MTSTKDAPGAGRIDFATLRQVAGAAQAASPTAAAHRALATMSHAAGRASFGALGDPPGAPRASSSPGALPSRFNLPYPSAR